MPVIIPYRLMTQPESTHIARADPSHPHLRFGVASKEAVRRREFVSVYLISPYFDVDHHKLPLVAHCDVRAYVAFVNLVAALSELFFAVTWLWSRHRIPPDDEGSAPQ